MHSSSKLYTREPPSCGLGEKEIAYVLKVLKEERPARPDGMEDDVWEMVCECWMHDYQSRLASCVDSWCNYQMFTTTKNTSSLVIV